MVQLMEQTYHTGNQRDFPPVDHAMINALIDMSRGMQHLKAQNEVLIDKITKLTEENQLLRVEFANFKQESENKMQSLEIELQNSKRANEDLLKALNNTTEELTKVVDEAKETQKKVDDLKDNISKRGSILVSYKTVMCKLIRLCPWQKCMTNRR